MNDMKVVTTKQVRAANQAMLLRNSQPIFSGNINCYLVNQLAEFEIICKVKQIMSKDDLNKAHLSSIYPYYTRLIA